jgi:hypothetical protein
MQDAWLRRQYCYGRGGGVGETKGAVAKGVLMGGDGNTNGGCTLINRARGLVESLTGLK